MCKLHAAISAFAVNSILQAKDHSMLLLRQRVTKATKGTDKVLSTSTSFLSKLQYLSHESANIELYIPFASYAMSINFILLNNVKK